MLGIWNMLLDGSADATWVSIKTHACYLLLCMLGMWNMLLDGWQCRRNMGEYKDACMLFVIVHAGHVEHAAGWMAVQTQHG
jgi:hypothetical protein